jgi:ribosomal protein S18 acetylase RimI-like enzyme
MWLRGGKASILQARMGVRVQEAAGAGSFREFLHLPERLYRGDPDWSPPLWADERRTFTCANPILAHSDYRLLLARREGRAVGRVLAYVDRSFNAFYRSATGFFGAFESEDAEAADALLGEAESWLASRGMRSARGPINPVSECWGFLLEGHGRPATFMSPYNPPRYNDYAVGRGYAKAKDLLVYEADALEGYRIPERFLEFRRRLLERRPRLAVRRLELRRLEQEAEAIWRISNEAISGNWGYVPLDRQELTRMFRQLKPIADPDAIWMVEDCGKAVGYALGFPDLNVLLRRIHGRLLPFGFLTLLAGVRRLRDFRLFGLAVLPAYHGLGLDVLLYMSLFEALQPRGVRLEANYILEDNARIRNALEKLQLTRSKVYRVYEKGL